MVLLALPPADHLLIERDRGQFVPSRRRRMMANARAERLLKIPAEPSPELRIPGAAAQTRVVSLAGIRLDSRKSVRPFKGIICYDISEFESYMPSQAVGSLWRVYPVHGLCEQRMAQARFRVHPQFTAERRDLPRKPACVHARSGAVAQQDRDARARNCR